MLSEGDQWYARNRAALNSNHQSVGWLCAQLAPFKAEINAVLEIGCGNGVNLRAICQLLSCRGEGIEPSSLAVQEGNATGGEMARLQVGVASRLPYADYQFDLVYFGFCLYLLDRKDLLAAVSEADRVLKPGGFLAITDFDPAVRHARPYRHLPGLMSYKQDYAACFLQNGLYHLVAKHSYSHRQFYFDRATDERVATVLLYKEQNELAATT